MVAVPGATPVTTPVELFTVAIVVSLDVQTPPAVLLDKVDVKNAHAVVVPVIALGAGPTSAVPVSVQPLASVVITV
jgi:hypothetical protein